MRESRDGIPARAQNQCTNPERFFARGCTPGVRESVNLHAGIDSTLNIVNNEIKYKADVVEHYGALPEGSVPALGAEPGVHRTCSVRRSHAITAERGTITISTGRVDGPNVRVEWPDTGAGMATETLKRYFLTPFFTTKPVGKGTGPLGLSLSYGIVQKHSGRMECTAKLGVGTRFQDHTPHRARKKQPPSRPLDRGPVPQPVPPSPVPFLQPWTPTTPRLIQRRGCGASAAANRPPRPAEPWTRAVRGNG